MSDEPNSFGEVNSLPEENRNAYVYRHIRLDTNMPFYIGVGLGANYRRAKQKQKRNPFWKNVVAKTGYEVEILMNNITYEYALEKEKEFIKLYGRSDNSTGTLVNLTDGGDGVTGKITSEKRKKDLSVLMKGNKFASGTVISDERKLSISIFHKGKYVSHETRMKMSISNQLITDYQVEEMKKLRTLGMSNIEIAKIYNCCKQTVCNRLNGWGYKDRTSNK